MISIFNGRSRSLGDSSRKDVHLQLDVNLRKYLYLFKGAKWAVFTAISLHMDEKGWAWPTVQTLNKETGITRDTIHAALNQLAQLKLKGHRVLLRTKNPPPHYVAGKDEGNYARNFYLLFPSAAECERYSNEAGKSDDENRRHIYKENYVGKTGHGFSESEKPDMENPYMDFSDIKKNQGSKEEPSLKEEPHTHEEEPEPLAPRSPTAAKRVCVSPALTFPDYLRYARAQSSFHTPEAWASVHYERRDRDELIREWLESQARVTAEPRAAAPKDVMTFHEAANCIHSLKLAGHDVSSYIAQMDVADDVRERLIERFIRRETGEER